MDPGRTLRNQGLAVIETSCDESDSRLEQMYDDDKMELMCHEGISDYIDFEMSRYGQVRSPFQVDVVDQKQVAGKQITFGIDGEFYELKNCRKIMFQIDRTVPQIKVLKRTTQSDKASSVVDTQEIFTELKQTYKPTLF